MGFAPRSGIDLDILPKGMTTCEERIANGQMVDCFGCGKVKPRITGFCKQCEKKGLHLPFRIALKDTGITIWDLSREEVYDIAVQAELDKSIK